MGSVYQQPGTEVDIPVTAGGCQVSRRGHRRETKELIRGRKEQGDWAMYIVTCICVYNNNNRNECCC
jgi:hypothetical protein